MSEVRGATRMIKETQKDGGRTPILSDKDKIRDFIKILGKRSKLQNT